MRTSGGGLLRIRLLAAVPVLAALMTPASISAARADDSQSLTTILEEYDALRLGPCTDAGGIAFAAGHLTVHFESGTVCLVLTRSGERAGYSVEGDGRFRYTSADAGDRQTFARNLTALSRSLAVGADGSTGSVVHTALILTARALDSGGVALNSPGPSGLPRGGSVPRPASAGAAQRLSGLLVGMDDSDFGAGHAAARALLGSAAPLPADRLPVYAEFEGRGPTVGYLLDPVSNEERLLVHRTVRGDRFAQVVSRQSMDGLSAEPPLVLTDLDVAFETADNRTARLRLSESLTVRSDLGRVLVFELANHDDAFARSWRSSARPLRVVSVQDEEGRSLPFSHRYHELLVELPRPAHAGDRIPLRFDIALEDVRPSGGQEWMWLGTWAWFPRPEWEGSVRARCHFVATTRKPWRPVAPGRVVGLTEQGQQVTLETQLDAPVRFPTVFAGSGVTVSLERDGHMVQVHQSGPGSGGSDAARRAAFAADLLDFYGALLGPYPLDALHIVDVHQSGLWRSPAGVVLISGRPAAGPPTPLAAAGRDGLGDWTLFAHEIAHQWWGNLVEPRSFLGDAWISESVAEYLAGMSWWETAPDSRGRDERLHDCLVRWRAMAEASEVGVSLARADYLRGEENEAHRRNLLYGRGPLVIRMLADTMGEPAFERLLKRLVQDHSSAPVSPAEIERVASEEAGQNLDWFFRQWIAEPGIPRVRVEMTMATDDEGRLLTGSLSQDADAGFPRKRLRVPLVYDLPGGLSGSVVIPLEGESRAFRVRIPMDAANPRPDPDRATLVRYH